MLNQHNEHCCCNLKINTDLFSSKHHMLLTTDFSIFPVSESVDTKSKSCSVSISEMMDITIKMHNQTGARHCQRETLNSFLIVHFDNSLIFSFCAPNQCLTKHQNPRQQRIVVKVCDCSIKFNAQLSVTIVFCLHVMMTFLNCSRQNTKHFDIFLFQFCIRQQNLTNVCQVSARD